MTRTFTITIVMEGVAYVKRHKKEKRTTTRKKEKKTLIIYR